MIYILSRTTKKHQKTLSRPPHSKLKKIHGLFQDCVNPIFSLHQQYLSSKKVIRIYTTVTKGETLWSFIKIKLSQLILSEVYEDQSRELFCVCLLGLGINAPFHMIGDRILQVFSLGNMCMVSF